MSDDDPNLSKAAIAERMREVRDLLGYADRTEFARVLDVKSHVLRDVETAKAKPSSSLLKRLGEKFDVDQLWLLGLITKKKPFRHAWFEETVRQRPAQSPPIQPLPRHPGGDEIPVWEPYGNSSSEGDRDVYVYEASATSRWRAKDLALLNETQLRVLFPNGITGGIPPARKEDLAPETPKPPDDQPAPNNPTGGGREPTVSNP